MADGDGERMRERERGAPAVAPHSTGTVSRNASARGYAVAASRVSRSSLFRRRRRSWPLARSVRLLHFNPEIFPRLRARVCVASVRPHPQSATSQRYDVRVFLPPFHDSMCARGRARRERRGREFSRKNGRREEFRGGTEEKRPTSGCCHCSSSFSNCSFPPSRPSSTSAVVGKYDHHH